MATYEFWLKIGIVLLGSRFMLGEIVKFGSASLAQILVDMLVAGTIILAAARAFGLSGKLGSLLAISTSICGVSAIIAAKGRSGPATPMSATQSPPSWRSVPSPCSLCRRSVTLSA